MASTYYISPIGDDSTGNGSESTPWETMAHAYDNSSEGDTIYCQAGTHTWVDQTFTTGRTIQGAGKTLTFFDAGGASATFEPTAQWYCTNMVINDITFQNNGRQVASSGNTVYALFAFLFSLVLTVFLCKKIYNIQKVQLIRNSSNKLIQFSYPIFSIFFQITLFFLILYPLLYVVEVIVD